MKTYQFRGDTVQLEVGRYPNGRNAIIIISYPSGEEYLTATVNVPEIHLAGKKIIVKDWSENEGVLDFLVSNKITSAPKKTVAVGAGFVSAYVVDLLRTDI